MTYYIETKKDKLKKGERNQILIRSLIKTQRKNIGTPEEYVCDDPDVNDFFLNINQARHSDLIGEVETVDEELNDTDTPTPGKEPIELFPDGAPADDFLPTSKQFHMSQEETDALLDQFQMEDDDSHDFECIVDHTLSNSGLTLKVKYSSCDDTETFDVPFRVLKKDVPLELAKYIRDKVVEGNRRTGHFNTWAKTFLKNHSRTICRLHAYYNTGRTIRARKNRTRNGPSRNQRVTEKPDHEKHGITIPKNTREALLLDKANNNTLWSDAIAKEINSLKELGVFEFHPSHHKCPKQDGWSFAPMHMIFDIKREDLRYKARLVVGRHVIDSSKHNTYSSTIQDVSIRLLQLIAVRNELSIMTGDISNAFCTAPVAEKIFSRAGVEFLDHSGCIVILKRALYGLKTASRSFHEFFAECLMHMGFTPTRADPDLWYRKSDDYEGYDCMATHVDDIIIAAKRPAEYMVQIEQEFNVRNQEDSPSYYLGNSYKRDPTGRLHISSSKYLKEVLRQFKKKFGEVRKMAIPLRVREHPELDNTTFCSEAEHKQYQHIIGVCQWLVIAGRFDINYAVSSLSRFFIAPRQHQLQLA